LREEGRGRRHEEGGGEAKGGARVHEAHPSGGPVGRARPPRSHLLRRKLRGACFLIRAARRSSPDDLQSGRELLGERERRGCPLTNIRSIILCTYYDSTTQQQA